VRAAVAVAAVLFCGWQVATPIERHLGDRRDERFAWRMFSPDRLQRCHAWVDVRRAAPSGKVRIVRPDLRRELHAGWIGALTRGRPRVVDAYLRSRCADESVRAVTLQRRCVDPQGVRMPPIAHTLVCGEDAPNPTPTSEEEAEQG
jgi:hypothetical protein